MTNAERMRAYRAANREICRQRCREYYWRNWEKVRTRQNKGLPPGRPPGKPPREGNAEWQALGY